MTWEEYSKIILGNKKVAELKKEYNIDELLSYKKYKDNWNKLKECLKEVVNSSNGDDKDFVETILNIIQELEQGSDSNVKD